MTAADADPGALPRYLQLLWDREPAGRRGPRPGRTIQEIGAAGAAVADRDGLDGVSMKSVGAELGMTPMSLYRYVDAKDELLALMADVGYGSVDLALVTEGPWRRRLAGWARHLADRLLEHPWILDVPMSAPPLTPQILGWTDAGVRAFADLPLTGQQKLSALLVVDGYVRSHVRQSVSMGLVGPTDAADTADTAAGPAGPAGSAGESPASASASAPMGYVEALTLLLDPERFPALVASSSALDDDDDFFETELSFGLELVLDGIEALARRAR